MYRLSRGAERLERFFRVMGEHVANIARAFSSSFIPTAFYTPGLNFLLTLALLGKFPKDE